MTQARGSNAQLLMGYEATYGVTPSVTADQQRSIKLPINKSALSAKRSYADAQTITARRDAVPPISGNVDVTGNIVVPIDARYFGYWLKSCFGNPTTTSTGTAPNITYTHVFKVQNTQPSMILENGFTDIATYLRYNGCKVSKMSLSFTAAGGELTASIDVMGATESLQTTPLDTAPKTLNELIEQPTTVSLARFENFKATVMEGGVSIGTCRKLDITIDFGLDGDTYCFDNYNTRRSINEGIVQVSGSMEAIFNAAAVAANTGMVYKAINSKETSLKVTLGNVFDTVSSLEISLAELFFEQNSPGIEGPKGVLFTLPFRAFYQNNADGSIVKFTLKNDVSGDIYTTIPVS